jgi:hypothetical protein
LLLLLLFICHGLALQRVVLLLLLLVVLVVTARQLHPATCNPTWLLLMTMF